MPDKFQFHDPETAPEASKELLSKLMPKLAVANFMPVWQALLKR